MKATLYTIECISNLHVGSGQDNDGVIDGLIQRDVVTDLPCINASSLKGALREHCEKWNEAHNEDAEKVNVVKLFGKKVSGEENCEMGEYRFLDASILSIPRPSVNAPFVQVTCDEVVKELQDKASLFGVGLGDNEKETVLRLANVLETNNCSYEDFKKYSNNDELPVIARNYLENGVSKNLWYEQVLPRKSRLAFFILHDDGEINKAFDSAITSVPVQIGANASVGYGICVIKKC